ncbi:MAG: PEP-CTERM sorting domain-containing protein [Tolypothrix sp. Co-bin9]|nr:PEP-CTERM sorting domain-containing protein [Tolypothrix sp. Co-bin9]
MVPWQFYLAPWLVQTRFMAIFFAVVGLTIAVTPASALAFKLQLDGTKTKLTGNEAIDQFNLNRVQPYDFNKQRINEVSQLLQKAETSIQEIIQASEVSSETIDGKTFFIYHGDTNITPNTHTYTNTWKAPASPPKRKIPEPSTILGLIAIASLFVTQRQKIKIG